MKKVLWLMLVFLVAGCGKFGKVGGGEVACTTEAKICPDGSSVGRVGPKCEFEECADNVLDNALPYKAKFEVITEGLVRDFGLPMYLLQDPNLYLEASDPSVVNVNVAGASWGDFFGSLPFSVTDECLITGDGEKLCSGEGKVLRFVLNGEEVENVLEMPINEGDELKVVWE